MSIREVPRGRSFTPTNNGYWGAPTYDDVERQALEGYKPFKPDFSSADMFGALGQVNPTAAFSFLGSYLANRKNNQPVDVRSLPFFPDSTRGPWDEGLPGTRGQDIDPGFSIPGDVNGRDIDPGFSPPVKPRRPGDVRPV